MTELRNVTATLSGSYLGGNDLCKDAWKRQKVVLDNSLFHGVWTYDVSNKVWEESSVASGVHTVLASTGTLATSVNNSLQISSGTTAGNGCYLRSKRNPRYQPNRGHLYSTAGNLYVPTADGRRRFGVFCGCSSVARNGVYFELEGDGAAWTMYAVIHSNGSTTGTKYDITSAILAIFPTFDPAKNHVYDIQYQWRGAGDYFFYIDLTEVYVTNFLNVGTGVTLRMPALPVAFECETDTTTEITMSFNCVDITSEGGKTEDRQFGSISTGGSLISVTSSSGGTGIGTGVIAIWLPRSISYGGGTVVNTRDYVASKISSWCRDEAATQVYFASDVVATNLAGISVTGTDPTAAWVPIPESGGTALYMRSDLAGDTMDTAFASDAANMQLILNEWVDIEVKNEVVNPDQHIAPFYLTPGSIIVIAIQSVAGTDDAALTLYLSEEV